MRVVSIVGARPQFVKLAPVAKAFEAAGIEHTIVHTGQHYDVNMSDAFFVDLGIPDPDVHLGVGGGTHGVMTGRMLEQLDPVLEAAAPDWVLVYGDTNSTIAGTLSAVKQHLKVAHLEAGLRSFNRRMPEEHNRVMTDHAADLCLAPTELAMKHLADEGLAARSVLVGDVMTDVCLQVRDAVLADPRPVPGIPGVETGEAEYVLATIHRADNTDDPARLAAILDALDGRMARILNAASKMGAEIDSLADAINFGVAPAFIVWALLLDGTRVGWIVVLLYAVCIVLRLARYNAMLHVDGPAYEKEFFTGMPAPAGAIGSIGPIAAKLQFPGPWWDTHAAEAVVIVWMIAVSLLVVSARRRARMRVAVAARAGLASRRRISESRTRVAGPAQKKSGEKASAPSPTTATTNQVTFPV